MCAQSCAPDTECCTRSAGQGLRIEGFTCSSKHGRIGCGGHLRDLCSADAPGRIETTYFLEDTGNSLIDAISHPVNDSKQVRAILGNSNPVASVQYNGQPAYLVRTSLWAVYVCKRYSSGSDVLLETVQGLSDSPVDVLAKFAGECDVVGTNIQLHLYWAFFLHETAFTCPI